MKNVGRTRGSSPRNKVLSLYLTRQIGPKSASKAHDFHCFAVRLRHNVRERLILPFSLWRFGAASDFSAVRSKERSQGYRPRCRAALMEKPLLASEPAPQSFLVHSARQGGKFAVTLRTSQEWKTRGTIAPLASALLLKVAERQRLGLPHLREHRGAGGSGDRLFPFPSPCVPF